MLGQSSPSDAPGHAHWKVIAAVPSNGDNTITPVSAVRSEQVGDDNGEDNAERVVRENGGDSEDKQQQLQLQLVPALLPSVPCATCPNAMNAEQMHGDQATRPENAVSVGSDEVGQLPWPTRAPSTAASGPARLGPARPQRCETAVSDHNAMLLSRSRTEPGTAGILLDYDSCAGHVRAIPHGSTQRGRWIIDSGAAVHVVPSVSCLATIIVRPSGLQRTFLRVANGTRVQVTHIGSVNIPLTSKSIDGCTQLTIMTLSQVFVVPEIKDRLFSTRSAKDRDGVITDLDHESLTLRDGSTVLFDRSYGGEYTFTPASPLTGNDNEPTFRDAKRAKQ